jgi:hypothetical protein
VAHVVEKAAFYFSFSLPVRHAQISTEEAIIFAASLSFSCSFAFSAIHRKMRAEEPPTFFTFLAFFFEQVLSDRRSTQTKIKMAGAGELPPGFGGMPGGAGGFPGMPGGGGAPFDVDKIRECF